MNGVTKGNLSSLEADFKAAKDKVEEINPSLVFELMKGNPVADRYEGTPEIREFRSVYQKLHTAQRYV